jgi:thiol-disulfide isomerase/thioredoxin
MKWFLSVIMLLLAACAPAAPTTSPTTAPVSQATTVPTVEATTPPAQATSAPVLPTSTPAEPTTTPATAADTSAAAVGAELMAYNGPAWASLPLVNAETGERFTLADFAGKTVFVEPFATWCTNCRRQLPNVEAARQQVDPAGVVFVALSVAENVDNATLSQYAADNGWDFIYAAASMEVTQGLVDSFGRTAITPPSTPHFIIRPDGSLTPLATGTHDAAALVAAINAAAGA